MKKDEYIEKLVTDSHVCIKHSMAKGHNRKAFWIKLTINGIRV